jgi:hypothetical protein
MDDDLDETIRRRLGAVARGVAGSATAPPGTMRRVVRRHRIGLAARVATGTLATGLLVLAVPLLVGPGANPAGLQPADVPVASSPPGTSPSPTAVVTRVPEPPSRPPSPTTAPDVPSPTASPTATPTVAPSVAARPVCDGQVTPEQPTPGGVTVRVETSRVTVRPGEPVRLTIRVKNEGALPVRYTTSGMEYDFWATDEQGLVWQWSFGRPYTLPLLTKQLDPGEERVESVDWDVTGCAAEGETPAPLPAGYYAVRGLWVSDAENGRAWWSDSVDLAVR